MNFHRMDVLGVPIGDLEWLKDGEKTMQLETDFEWDLIYKSTYNETWRAMVIGGWLVRHRELGSDNGGEALSMVFIADPSYSWEI
ncbi:hypothetical protein CCP3SC1AL1_910014 [Gammaproteobacteria bacterium]